VVFRVVIVAGSVVGAGPGSGSSEVPVCGDVVHPFGRGPDAEEHDTEVMLCGLPCGGLAADVGGDPTHDHGVDPPVTQLLSQTSSVEAAAAGPVHDEVVRRHVKGIMQLGRRRTLGIQLADDLSASPHPLRWALTSRK